VPSFSGETSVPTLTRGRGLELLHRRTKDDLIDVDIGRLLDGIGDGAGDAVGRDRLLVEVDDRVTARLMTTAELQVGVDGAWLDGRRADRTADFMAQAFGYRANRELGTRIDPMCPE
jgi:hypothetical protein